MTTIKSELTKSPAGELVEKHFAVPVDTLPVALAEAITELAKLANRMTPDDISVSLDLPNGTMSFRAYHPIISSRLGYAPRGGGISRSRTATWVQCWRLQARKWPIKANRPRDLVGIRCAAVEGLLNPSGWDPAVASSLGATQLGYPPRGARRQQSYVQPRTNIIKGHAGTNVLAFTGMIAMEPIGIADPEQLAALAQALDRYCDAHHITNEQERKNLAALIMDLFGRGLTSAEEILSALEEMGSQQ